MCEECGCGKQEHNRIIIEKSVDEANMMIAQEVRTALKRKEILCVNIMGAPGSGKTTVIEKIARLIPKERIAVIQGDLESDIDKKRLERQGITSYQINTHSGCHLTAVMINRALIGMDLTEKEYLLIENVGNLVCPAGIPIGQHINILISSVTEGSDKPHKYPHIFNYSSMIIITKNDLAEAVKFDDREYTDEIKKSNPKAKMIRTDWNDFDSYKEILHFLEHEREHLLGKEHTHED